MLGLVGAPGRGNNRGSAYLFRNLNTVTGTVTETASLAVSDAQDGDQFGIVLSASGNLGLVSAPGSASGRGAAYLFRNLDTAAGSITESAKLVASDGLPADHFGGFILPRGISLSGNNALIGASGDTIGTNSRQGSAYLFTDLDSAAGTIFESVKLTASAGTQDGVFGESVDLDGDRFVIGSPRSNAQTNAIGRAYSGSVSSVTRLDAGNASRAINGLSFTSRGDWIIGDTTDANLVSLGAGDTASVLEAGKAVFIGKNAGSDGNTLRIDGTLNATEVFIGSITGNGDNTLQLANTATFDVIAFRLAPDNLLKIAGSFTAIDTLLTYLGTTDLQAWDGNLWQSVDRGNYASFITSSFDAGYTEVKIVPEPTCAALILMGLGFTAGRKRWRGEQ